MWFGDVLVGSVSRASEEPSRVMPGKVAGSWFDPIGFAEKAGKEVQLMKDAWVHALAN